MRNKSLDARVVANQLITIAEQNETFLTPMQILKLTYFCHAWMLALYDEPLIRNTIQAWRHGPVIPDVYFAFRQFGRSRVTSRVPYYEWQGNPDQEHIVNEVWRVYGKLDGWQLSELTHAPGTPWDTVWRSGGGDAWYQNASRKRIPNHLIKTYYQSISQSDTSKND